MSSAPLSELYALALRTLDAHERRAGDLRARLAPVLAAGGIGMTLLAGPAFEGAAHESFAAAAVVAAVGGLLAALHGTMVMSLQRSDVLDLDVLVLLRAFALRHALQDLDAFNREMIAMFAVRAEAYRVEFDVLHGAFTRIVWGMLLMLCGLGVAALVG